MVKFVFDGAWKTLHKVVQFTQCEETYNLVLGTEGTTCLLPAELHPGAVNQWALAQRLQSIQKKTERTLESLQKQIDNLTSGRNYTVLFQSGQNAISTYASNLSMILDGRYQTMADFLTAYPQFCSAENDFMLSYSQTCFNWDKSVLTVCAKPLSLTKNAEIVMSYQSGSSEAGSLYLVQKPQKIDIPIGVYVNTEIDANRAVSLDFQWLQSETCITTITECTGISDGEYYLAWAGRSNNSHPKIRFLKVLED